MILKNVSNVKGNNVVKTLKTENNMKYGKHKGNIKLHLCLMDNGDYHLRIVKYFKNGTGQMLDGQRFSSKEKIKAIEIFNTYVKFSKS